MAERSLQPRWDREPSLWPRPILEQGLRLHLTLRPERGPSLLHGEQSLAPPSYRGTTASSLTKGAQTMAHLIAKPRLQFCTTLGTFCTSTWSQSTALASATNREAGPWPRLNAASRHTRHPIKEYVWRLVQPGVSAEPRALPKGRIQPVAPPCKGTRPATSPDMFAEPI